MGKLGRAPRKPFDARRQKGRRGFGGQRAVALSNVLGDGDHRLNAASSVEGRPRFALSGAELKSCLKPLMPWASLGQLHEKESLAQLVARERDIALPTVPAAVVRGLLTGMGTADF